jgi:hypothetical protein
MHGNACTSTCVFDRVLPSELEQAFSSYIYGAKIKEKVSKVKNSISYICVYIYIYIYMCVPH